MTDIKLPPMPQTIENRLSDFAVACAFGQHELRASAARELRQAIEEHAREAVRLNTTVPDGWSSGVIAVADMLRKKADDFALQHGYDDMGGLSFGRGAHAEAKMDWHSGLTELEEEIRAMISAAPAPTPPAQQPLTDEQCDAIYMALDNWAREFDEYEFGLPHSCGGGVEGGREIIRQAHGIGVKND